MTTPRVARFLLGIVEVFWDWNNISKSGILVSVNEMNVLHLQSQTLKWNKISETLHWFQSQGLSFYCGTCHSDSRTFLLPPTLPKTLRELLFQAQRIIFSGGCHSISRTVMLPPGGIIPLLGAVVLVAEHSCYFPEPLFHSVSHSIYFYNRAV